MHISMTENIQGHKAILDIEWQLSKELQVIHFSQVIGARIISTHFGTGEVWVPTFFLLHVNYAGG